MGRSSMMAIFWLMMVSALAGCWDSTHGSRRYRATPTPTACRQVATCGACTPIPGCGWCSVGGGGFCVDDPGACAGFSQFQWTWDPAGCPASQGTNDAGSPGDAQSHDAAAGEPSGDATTTDVESSSDVAPDLSPGEDAHGAAGAGGVAGAGGAAGANGGAGAGGAAGAGGGVELGAKDAGSD